MVAVKVAVGPAAVVAVGVTPMPDTGGLFLRTKLTRSLLSRTSITPKKCMPRVQQPRRLSTGSSGTQERNETPVLLVSGRPESVRPTFPTLFLPSPLLSAISALSDMTKRTSKEVTDDDPQTHPNVITLPRFANRPRRPNKTDPLPYVYLPFEPFAWQLTLDIILLTLVLKKFNW